jgi:beta-galactosidase
MLVIDEAFDCWKIQKEPYDYHLYFDEWWKRDLESMVRRDRNHPSIIMWSIGNEIRGQYEAPAYETGKMLSAHLRTLDTTRPVTQAMNTRPEKNGMQAWDEYCAEALDIVGDNYRLTRCVQEDHPRVPNRVMVSTETYPGSVFEMWTDTVDNSFVLGEFVWTAMDYLGESNNGHWDYESPKQENVDQTFWHGSGSGALDETGLVKDDGHYRNVVWDRGEKMYLTVGLPLKPGQALKIGAWAVSPTHRSWNWSGWENHPMKVEVYSRHDSVKLYLDSELIGEMPTTRKEEFKAIFTVPYRPGVLKAVGVVQGIVKETQTLETTGEPVSIRLMPDRTKLKANGQDLSFISVIAVDKQGRFVPTAANEISFKVEGAGSSAGVANGDLRDPEPYHGTKRKLYKGHAQLVVRTSYGPGAITVSAHALGLTSQPLILTSQ